MHVVLRRLVGYPIARSVMPKIAIIDDNFCHWIIGSFPVFFQTLMETGSGQVCQECDIHFEMKPA